MAPWPQTIDREIRQTKPFRSLQEQVVINLMRTTRAGRGRLDPVSQADRGISPSQYNILRILRGARPKAAKISEISDRMITRDPDVTRLVDRLIKQGLVRRERDTDDRRVVLVEITAAGPGAAVAPRRTCRRVYRGRHGGLEGPAAQNPGCALERGQGRDPSLGLIFVG